MNNLYFNIKKLKKQFIFIFDFIIWNLSFYLTFGTDSNGNVLYYLNASYYLRISDNKNIWTAIGYNDSNNEVSQINFYPGIKNIKIYNKLYIRPVIIAKCFSQQKKQLEFLLKCESMSFPSIFRNVQVLPVLYLGYKVNNSDISFFDVAKELSIGTNE